MAITQMDQLQRPSDYWKLLCFLCSKHCPEPFLFWCLAKQYRQAPTAAKAQYLYEQFIDEAGPPDQAPVRPGKAPLIATLNWNTGSSSEGKKIATRIASNYLSCEADVFDEGADWQARQTILTEYGAQFEPAQNTRLPALYADSAQVLKAELKALDFAPEVFLNYNSDPFVVHLRDFARAVREVISTGSG